MDTKHRVHCSYHSYHSHLWKIQGDWREVVLILHGTDTYIQFPLHTEYIHSCLSTLEPFSHFNTAIFKLATLRPCVSHWPAQTCTTIYPQAVTTNLQHIHNNHHTDLQSVNTFLTEVTFILPLYPQAITTNQQHIHHHYPLSLIHCCLAQWPIHGISYLALEIQWSPISYLALETQGSPSATWL